MSVARLKRELARAWVTAILSKGVSVEVQTMGVDENHRLINFEWWGDPCGRCGNADDSPYTCLCFYNLGWHYIHNLDSIWPDRHAYWDYIIWSHAHHLSTDTHTHTRLLLKLMQTFIQPSPQVPTLKVVWARLLLLVLLQLDERADVGCLQYVDRYV